MHTSVTWGLFLALGVSTTALGQPVLKITTCFEEAIAPLRLSQLEGGIDLCSKVIEATATSPDRRAEAFAQRGLMNARRWSILGNGPAFAVQGIADITESLQLRTPPAATRHQLLLVRGQLYAATGQLRRAAADYNAILADDPANSQAQQGLRRAGPQEGM